MVGRPYAGDRNSHAACHLDVCKVLTAGEQDMLCCVVLRYFAEVQRDCTEVVVASTTMMLDC